MKYLWIIVLASCSTDEIDIRKAISTECVPVASFENGYVYRCDMDSVLCFVSTAGGLTCSSGSVQ